MLTDPVIGRLASRRRGQPSIECDTCSHAAIVGSGPSSLGAAAAVGYVLGDALAAHGTRLGYALLALAVLATLVADAVDATPVDPTA